MRYDTTLKELFRQAPQRLFKLLINDTAQELLTVEFPTVRQRRPDLVARLTGGGIFHLELQSTQPKIMLWRMLEYYMLITLQLGQPPIQRLLYVGKRPLRMADTLRLPNLHFHCPVIDIREIDSQLLLESPQFEDRLLAILGRMEDPQRTLRVILESIVQLPSKSQLDALAQLTILSGLRDLESVLKQEVKHMPITVDIRQNLFFKEAFEEGLQEGRSKGIEEGITQGEAQILLRLLQRRFGDIPPQFVTRIQSADNDTLLRWSERILSAQTLEDVFQE